MILLDTHALIWLRQGNERLGSTTREKIDLAYQRGELAVAAISFWEIGMLHAKGRIRLGVDLPEWRRTLIEQGLVEIAIDGAIGLKATMLQDFHGEPADCLIVSTALINACELVTADNKILNWSGELRRHDAAV